MDRVSDVRKYLFARPHRTRTFLLAAAVVVCAALALGLLRMAEQRPVARSAQSPRARTSSFTIDPRRPLTDEVRRFLDKYGLKAKLLYFTDDFVNVPRDLHKGRNPDGIPWRTLLKASRAAHLDFRGLAGSRVEVLRADLGPEPNRGYHVIAHMLRSGRQLVGAWLQPAGPPPARALPLRTWRGKLVPGYASRGPRNAKVGVALAAVQEAYFAGVVPEAGRQDYMVVVAGKALKAGLRRKLRPRLKGLGTSVTLATSRPPWGATPATATSPATATASPAPGSSRVSSKVSVILTLGRIKVRGKKAQVRVLIEGEAVGTALYRYRLVRKGTHWRVIESHLISIS